MTSDTSDQVKDTSATVGVVVIGRNEGERLKLCLRSLLAQAAEPVVYVDSGSTDGSVAFAESVGVDVVALDMSRPFTMARGRNAGLRHLLERFPETRWVQFVDGDCEVDSGWLQAGMTFLQEHPTVGVVCGYVRERFPEATVYNRLFDIECRGPAGSVDACGGPAMYRVATLREVGDFEEAMIAGEEPELCVRLRRAGKQVWRLDRPMALHDAAMERFVQWWKRATRCGHAYADGYARQGRTEERHCRRQLISSLVYGAAVPGTVVSAVLMGTLAPQFALLRTGALAFQAAASTKVVRGAYKYRRELGDPSGDAFLYAVACAVSKTPEAFGALRFLRDRLARRDSTLIEYRRS